jgi:hypothetical protein
VAPPEPSSYPAKSIARFRLELRGGEHAAHEGQQDDMITDEGRAELGCWFLTGPAWAQSDHRRSCRQPTLLAAVRRLRTGAGGAEQR